MLERVFLRQKFLPARPACNLFKRARLQNLQFNFHNLVLVNQGTEKKDFKTLRNTLLTKMRSYL